MEVRFLIFVFLSLSNAAFAGRNILIYPQTNSVPYTNAPGKGFCRLGLSQSEPAEVLEENGGYIRVRFKNTINGCSLFSGGSQEGWIPKNEIAYGEDDNSPVELTRGKSADCDPLMEKPKGFEDIAKKAGMKSAADIEKYMECFANSSQGFENYKKYSPVMDKITSNFAFKKAGQTYSVDPALFRCLIRRESTFNPQDKSTTGAMGLGQHTDVNIRHINNRLKQPNSWERQLWDRFFNDAQRDPRSKAMLAECPRTAGGQPPKFESKADAACPLNSLAASAIYNLQIQEGLRRSAGVKSVTAGQQLDYQIAIGATYNLGDGAASKAVNDLVVDGWVDAIHKQSPTPEKSSEVANHIKALRNCMQAGNWNPMVKGDPNRCKGSSTPASKR